MKRGVGLAVAISGLLALGWLAPAGATAPPGISFESFTGTYHLSRDSYGLSLLTSEEAIVADFPDGGNYSGITRSIPEAYQGHSVQVQVLGVTDGAGDPVPYKTASQNGNLVVTTGDPSITLYGSQIFHITYHTTGVINLTKGADQLILDVNGRGWSQPFPTVSATLYIPDSFQARLTTQPSCYLALDNLVDPNCSLTDKHSGQSRVVAVEAHNLAANQTLVLKMAFAPATFTNSHKSWLKPVLLAGAVLPGVIIVVSLIIDSFWPSKKRTKNAAKIT